MLLVHNGGMYRTNLPHGRSPLLPMILFAHIIGVILMVIAVLLIFVAGFIFTSRDFLYNDFRANWVYVAPPVFCVIAVALIFGGGKLIAL